MEAVNQDKNDQNLFSVTLLTYLFYLWPDHCRLHLFENCSTDDFRMIITYLTWNRCAIKK